MMMTTVMKMMLFKIFVDETKTKTKTKTSREQNKNQQYFSLEENV